MANLPSHKLAKTIIDAKLGVEKLQKLIAELTNTPGYREHRNCASSSMLGTAQACIDDAHKYLRSALDALPRAEQRDTGWEAPDCTCEDCMKSPKMQKKLAEAARKRRMRAEARQARQRAEAEHRKLVAAVVGCRCGACYLKREEQRVRRRREEEEAWRTDFGRRTIAQKTNYNAKARQNG